MDGRITGRVRGILPTNSPENTPHMNVGRPTFWYSPLHLIRITGKQELYRLRRNEIEMGPCIFVRIEYTVNSA